MMNNKINNKKYNKNNENVFITSLLLSLFMQHTKTTTKSYNENVFVTSLLLSLFMRCNGHCGHLFIDVRSEVTNTFSLPFLKEAMTNQIFLSEDLNFTTNNQQYQITIYHLTSWWHIGTCSMIMSSLSTESALDWGLFWVNEMTTLVDTFCFQMTCPNCWGIGFSIISYLILHNWENIVFINLLHAFVLVIIMHMLIKNSWK